MNKAWATNREPEIFLNIFWDWISFEGIVYRLQPLPFHIVDGCLSVIDRLIDLYMSILPKLDFGIVIFREDYTLASEGKRIITRILVNF